jgi:hypothetical protein
VRDVLPSLAGWMLGVVELDGGGALSVKYEAILRDNWWMRWRMEGYLFARWLVQEEYMMALRDVIIGGHFNSKPSL